MLSSLEFRKGRGFDLVQEQAQQWIGRCVVGSSGIVGRRPRGCCSLLLWLTVRMMSVWWL